MKRSLAIAVLAAFCLAAAVAGAATVEGLAPGSAGGRGVRTEAAASSCLCADRLPGPLRHLGEGRHGPAKLEEGDRRLRSRRAPTAWAGCRRARWKGSENATPEEARSVCRGAIVGAGHVGATIALPGQAPIPASLAVDPVQRRTSERQPDGHLPCAHHRPGDTDLCDRGADRTAPRQLRLPRHDRYPPDRGRLRRAHPPRREDRPSLQLRAAAGAATTSARCSDGDPRNPRPLRLRRRKQNLDLRRRPKTLHPSPSASNSTGLPILPHSRAASSTG